MHSHQRALNSNAPMPTMTHLPSPLSPPSSLSPHSTPLPQRRRLLVAGAAWVGAPAFIRDARAQETRRLTPSQTEGPYYPVTLPADSDADLLAQGSLRYTLGQATWLDGVVTDTAGRAVNGAVVEIWQCDQQGHYHHPGDGGRADPAFQGFGRAAAGADGAYRFRTIRPAHYAGRTPHIHVKVKLGRRELLTTQLYAEGDPHNAGDSLWRRLSSADRAALTRPFEPVADGLRARFDIVVAA
jgi:protocatechuate 3,4-dioxygenase, beta subunit